MMRRGRGAGSRRVNAAHPPRRRLGADPYAQQSLTARLGSARGDGVAAERRRAVPPKPRAEAGPSLTYEEGEQMGREARVMRYKEKRKNRKFDKTIRYASRKAYAESRPRVKGRFVKREEMGGAGGGGSDAPPPPYSYDARHSLGGEMDLLNAPGMGMGALLDPPLLWLEEQRTHERGFA